MCSVIEYSLDGGRTWVHSRTIQDWVAADPGYVRVQRSVVCDLARREHGMDGIITRMLTEDDPRGVLNQP